MHALAAWLRLTETAGVGNETARKLLSAFGLPENIFSASHAALSAVVPQRLAQALLAPASAATEALIERTVAWSCLAGNHVLTLADAAYPRRLLEIADPPVILYAKGQLDLLSAPSIAIVGSRNASLQGVANAEQFAAALCSAGLSIVSGMALGIDTAAHRGSLQARSMGMLSGSNSANPASTIAVIGTGADLVYPARNRSLAHQIAEFGCILSEYPLGTPAIAANFPRRNRIISGLARGVLVIEAAARSGSLITARMAAEQGRDVFAVPGSIHSPLAKGCHQLIKQGAKLVESAQDILEELQSGDLPRAVAMPVQTPSSGSASGESIALPHGRGSAASSEADASSQSNQSIDSRKVSESIEASNSIEVSNPIEAGEAGKAGESGKSSESGDALDARLLDAIGFDPLSHDALALRCGLDSASLHSRLLVLELRGLIELLPNGAYQRIR